MRTIIRPHKSEEVSAKYPSSSGDPLFVNDTVAFQIEEEDRSTETADFDTFGSLEHDIQEDLTLKPSTDLKRLSLDAVPTWERDDRSFTFGHGVRPIAARRPRRVVPIVASGVCIGVIGAFFLLAPQKDPAQVVRSEVASVVIRAEEPKAPQVFPEGATGILESVSPEGSEEVSAENTTEEAPISAKEMIEGRNVPLQERSFLHTGIATIRDGHPILINSHVAKPERAAEGSDPGLSLSSREDGSDRFGVTGSEADWQGGWHLNNPEKNIALGKAYKEYLRKSTGASEFEDLSVVRKSGSSVTATFGKR